MTLRNKEVAQPIRTPVLSATLLARVHELNRNYIELLAAQANLPPFQADGLPQKWLAALAQLPELARWKLAATPFALFTLRFEDSQFWRTALGESGVADGDDPLRDYYGNLQVAPKVKFCELALFFAWHTAVLNCFAARVVLGMPALLAERIVHAPLWRLRRIAVESPTLLSPRWPGNPAFWPDLIHFAANSDWRRLATAQLLGHQLTAVDLDAAFNEGRLPGQRAYRAGVAKSLVRTRR